MVSGSDDDFSDEEIEIPPDTRYGVTHWADDVPNIFSVCVYYIGFIHVFQILCYKNILDLLCP